MDTNSRDPFEAFERAALWGAIIGLLLLMMTYFSILWFTFLHAEFRTFSQSVITNLVATLIAFVIAGLLYHQIRKLQSERAIESLAKNVAEEVGIHFRRTITSLQDAIPSAERGWLYRADELLKLENESKSTEIWIVSPHLLNDTGTVLLTV